jgi:hypothetical protein
MVAGLAGLLIAPACAAAPRPGRTGFTSCRARRKAQLPFYLPICLSLLSAAPAAGQRNQTGAASRLVVMANLASTQLDMTSLELVRRRLPITVTFGRFAMPDGTNSSVCVSSRRNRTVQAQEPAAGWQNCAMIGVVVDGTAISDAGAYLEATRLSSLESIELLNTADAYLHYGLAAHGAEVLVIWTRGRGPHARAPLEFQRLVIDNASPDVIRVSIDLGNREIPLGQVEPMGTETLRIRPGMLPPSSPYARILIVPVGTPAAVQLPGKSAGAIQSDPYPLSELVQHIWRFSGSRIQSLGPVRL